jgi:tetratricopeptide (TPR) repeat protein
VDYQQQKVAQVIARTLLLVTLTSAAAGPVAAQSGPYPADAWVQMADVEASRGNLAGCVEALQKAVAASPADASLYARLSQTYASAGSGNAALHAIEAALALQPGRPEYLRARATLATWIGDYRTARDSYRQLETVYPEDLDLALALARVSAWAGDTDRAVKEFTRYLKAKASNAPVWLELAKAESWRGNYAGAIEALDAYKRHAGVSREYFAQLAAVLAAAGRPAQAEDLLADLLAQSPADYDLNLTHTLALGSQQRARAAFESLETIRQLSPDGAQTRTAERVLHTLLGSSAESPFTSYSDSDALRVRRFAPRARVALNSGTQLSAGYDRSELDARAGSGLDTLDGHTAATVEQTWVGAAQRFGTIAVNGQIGYARANEQVSTTYGVGIDARLADGFRFMLSRASGPLVVSPRTVDLGLMVTHHRAQIDWTPTLRAQVDADASFDELSDGNRRWEVTFSPRRTVARRARFNLDLGATAYRLQTTHDLDHGYYDPRAYEYYAATLYPYIKFRENVGLAMTAGLGVQRDNTTPSFRLGGNVTGEATFGIYRPWILKLNGAATLNGRLDSGAFRAFSVAAALVRRF